MIRINLLPFRAARKTENIRRQVSLFFLSLVLVVLVISFVQIGLSRKIKKLNAEVQTVKQELEVVKKDAKKVAEMKKKLNTLEKKTDVMRKLDTNRKDPVILLDAMTELVVPNRMWFKSFDASGNKVIINGVTLDNKTTADFMTRLEGSALFTSVTLHSVRAGSDKMKNFGITCVKAPPEKSGGK